MPWTPTTSRSAPSGPTPTNSNYTQADETLTYTIRFQNTGNDTAFAVRIEDQLSEYLDPATFKPLTGSHPYTVHLSDAGLATFEFRDIELVDSTENAAGSEGYVTFEVMAYPDVRDFTVVANTASIIFDRNKPVITNTVISTLVQELDADQDSYFFYEDCDDHNATVFPLSKEIAGNGIDEDCDGKDAVLSTATTATELDGELLVFPSPTTGTLRLEYSGSTALRVTLLDGTGRQLLQESFSGRHALSLTPYAAGIYLVRLEDPATGRSTVRRVVRQ